MAGTRQAVLGDGLLQGRLIHDIPDWLVTWILARLGVTLDDLLELLDEAV